MYTQSAISRGEQNIDIDVTPLLDVVFIMLIFFVVTASFVKEIGLDVSSEESNLQVVTEANKQSISIHIEESGSIWVNGSRTDIDAIIANIKRLKSQNPSSKIYIKPHPKSKTDILVRVFDKTVAAGTAASIVAEW
jgi:biopolymer transport protein ExbD